MYMYICKQPLDDEVFWRVGVLRHVQMVIELHEGCVIACKEKKSEKNPKQGVTRTNSRTARYEVIVQECCIVCVAV